MLHVVSSKKLGLLIRGLTDYTLDPLELDTGYVFEERANPKMSPLVASSA